nr:hypothetical protein [Tanacetum cinerariifolium]
MFASSNRATTAGSNPFNIGGSNVNISSGVFTSDANKKNIMVTGGGSNVTGMSGPIPSKSTGMFGNTSSITTEVTSDSIFTSSLNEEGLPQSPLVSPTAPLPLHQSNELLSGMTNDKRKVVIDALVTMHMSPPVEEVLIHSIDDVAALFGVPLNSLKDIDEFTKDLEVELTKETRSGITDNICNKWDTLLNMQKSAPSVVDDNLSSEALPSDTIDGISLISMFSYISSMCNDSWGRSRFVLCLIEVNSEADLVDVVTIGISLLTGDWFTKETICVEYEWRPPKCDICKIFGHVHNYCPKKVVSPPIVMTSTVVTPVVEKSNDGFKTMGNKKKRKGKSKSTNDGNASTSSSMLKTTGTSSKKDNTSTSSSFSALNDDEEEAVENIHDESANLFPITKTDGNLSFTVVAC